MARIPTAQEDAALDAMFVTSTTYYLALFTTDPGTTGASGEVTGGSYARQAIVFSAAASGSKTTTDTQTFSSMPVEAGGVPYYGVFTTLTVGTYLGGGTTTGLSGSLPAGININFAIGAVTWTAS